MGLGQALLFPVRIVTGVFSFGAAVFGVVGEETPAFEVLRTAGKAAVAYEVRRYAAYQAAETPSSEDGDGFMVLANYIGVLGEAKNEGAQKMAMTTPVASTMGQGGQGKMMFSLPKSVDAPPKPTDERVKTLTRPASTWAVHQYRGAWNLEQATSVADRLRAQLKEDGENVDDRSQWEWLRYNPPFTLPWFRTNEVAIKLRD